MSRSDSGEKGCYAQVVSLSAILYLKPHLQKICTTKTTVAFPLPTEEESSTEKVGE